MPLVWWGGSVLVSAIGGWAAGFFGSDTIKNLMWFALAAAAAIALFYVWSVSK